MLVTKSPACLVSYLELIECKDMQEPKTAPAWHPSKWEVQGSGCADYSFSISFPLNHIDVVLLICPHNRE